MAAHAKCSPSAAYRWLECTAAPTFEEQFPEVAASDYAREGTLAHSICELFVRREFWKRTPKRTLNAQLKKLQAEELYDDEMLTTAEVYVEYLREKALGFKATPFVAPEVRVDLTDYIPECFGTCDCVMFGDDTLHITDYKHGKGVPVSAIGNPQMRLYALGALRLYRVIFGDSIKRVSMAICQPRLSSNVEEDSMTVEELLAWGESVKPRALEAFNGPGEFVPGEHCRFCRGRERCRARADEQTSLEHFKSFVAENAEPKPGQSAILTDAEIGDLLKRGAELVQWYTDLQAYALGAILGGGVIPGFKVVEGRSNRAFSDPDAALQTIEAAGYDRAMLYDYKPKSLSELEKLLGKKDFAATVGDYVIKPPGKPTLVPETDKRPPYSPAAVDFAEVGGGGA